MPLTIIDWGSVADWFSGIGSLAAAVVALYIALYSQRVKLRAWCGHRIILTEGSAEPQIDMLAIDFGKLIWVHPSFWCKPDFLLFIMNEYQAAVCRS